MDIKLRDGSTLNTDKLSDIEAEIIEKQTEVGNLCRKYNVPWYSVSFADGERKPFISQHFDVDDKAFEERKLKRVGVLFSWLNDFVINASGGKYAITEIK